MEKKFKLFLETKFRSIPPTQASMEYRKQLLLDLLDYSQELKIKGISNEEIIYQLAVEKLGDMDELLSKFEQKRVSKRKLEKKNLATLIICLSIMIPTFLVYLVAGLTVKPRIWDWSWILLIIAACAVVTTLLAMYAFSFRSKYKKYLIQLPVLAIVAMWGIVIALVLLILNLKVPSLGLSKWWLSFIALPALLLLANAIVSLANNSKTKWINLALALIVMFTILYVILGLILPSFWHPGWLLILAGVVLAALEIGVVYGIKGKQNKKLKGNPNEIDDKYYSEW